MQLLDLFPDVATMKNVISTSALGSCTSHLERILMGESRGRLTSDKNFLLKITEPAPAIVAEAYVKRTLNRGFELRHINKVMMLQPLHRLSPSHHLSDIQIGQEKSQTSAVYLRVASDLEIHYGVRNKNYQVEAYDILVHIRNLLKEASFTHGNANLTSPLRLMPMISDICNEMDIGSRLHVWAALYRMASESHLSLVRSWFGEVYGKGAISGDAQGIRDILEYFIISIVFNERKVVGLGYDYAMLAEYLSKVVAHVEESLIDPEQSFSLNDIYYAESVMMNRNINVRNHILHTSPGNSSSSPFLIYLHDGFVSRKVQLQDLRVALSLLERMVLPH